MKLSKRHTQLLKAKGFFLMSDVIFIDDSSSDGRPVSELTSLIDPSLPAPFVPAVFTGVEQMAPLLVCDGECG
jgi:hypothetical protein